jgi:hypothetical protein
MKAWSQNLGHTEVLTTFTSYGAMPTHRQGELIRSHRGSIGHAGDLSREQVAAVETLLTKMKQEQWPLSAAPPAG